ncbi:uncharacterized protein LOC128554035, partial [Mercenaria mercenaria]|uniref:uncharacterized protein LOC128554035 n=1 Tax=Mercenaria mercenaria TaxID=6596 RepID=UPI00234F61EF
MAVVRSHCEAVFPQANSCEVRSPGETVFSRANSRGYDHLARQCSFEQMAVAKPSTFMTKASNVACIEKSMIQFEKVHTNDGDNFKPVPGIYMAPVDGIYVFNLAAILSDGVELGISHNGDVVGQADSDMKSTTVVIELKTEDTIYVKVNLTPEMHYYQTAHS